MAKKHIVTEEFIQTVIRQKVAELVEPYRQDWPITDDIVTVCFLKCRKVFNYFNGLGEIGEAKFQKQVRERIGQYRQGIEKADDYHVNHEPPSEDEKFYRQHEDGTLTLKYRTAINPAAGLTAYVRITLSVGIAFLEHYFIKAPAEARAKPLIEQAEAKAEEAFAQWVGGYLPGRLKHRTEADKANFLRQEYRKIQDWFAEKPDIMLDGTPEDVLGWVRAFFVDLEDGLRPKHSTPEHLKNVLADRLKGKKCLAYIDTLLEKKPAPQQQKPDTRQQALYHYYLMKAGVMPDLQGLRKELEELGEKLGLGPVSFYQTFNAIGYKKRDKNPLKLNILALVIPMLAEYPEALALAKKDLAALPKHTGK